MPTTCCHQSQSKKLGTADAAFLGGIYLGMAQAVRGALLDRFYLGTRHRTFLGFLDRVYLGTAQPADGAFLDRIYLGMDDVAFLDKI